MQLASATLSVARLPATKAAAAVFDKYHTSHRLEEPWVRLSLAAWVGCWIIPFLVLLGQAAKKTPQVLGTVCCFLLFGFWLERNALVWPSISPGDDSVWHAGIPIGIGLGFFGAFVLVQLLVHRVFEPTSSPTNIGLQFQLPDTDRVITCAGRIVHADPSNDAHGVAFTHVDPEHQRMIDDFVVANLGWP